MILAAALLAGLAGAQTTGLPTPTPRIRAIGEIVILRRGGWNERVHATNELGALGVDGLAGLRVAAEDADWQVRMTAVHHMGRAGPPAVPDLARVMEVEPCRHVRLIALNWLGAIGTPEASEAVRRGLDDESGMVRLQGRYWLGKEGEDGGSAGADAAAASDEDLKHCASSPGPGRLVVAEVPPAPNNDGSPVASPPSKPAAAAMDETLAEAPPALAARQPARPEARFEPLDRARLRELDDLLAPRAVESFPPGQPGLERPAPLTAGPAIMPDAGTGKSAVDPLPALKRLLLDADPRKRARAADELGRRGAAAISVEPALIAALKDRDRRVRASAALALGNFGAAADPAVPALVIALKRGPEDVERSAAVALGRIGTSRARRAFARYARQSAGDFLKREGRETK